MSVNWLYPIILIGLSQCVTAGEQPAPTIEDVVDSLDRVLDNLLLFSGTDIVADLLFGVVLVRGQIHVLRHYLERAPNAVCPKRDFWLVDKLAVLEAKCDQYLNRPRSESFHQSDDDFNKLALEILHPGMWEVDQPLKIGTLPEPIVPRIKSSIMELQNRMYFGLPNEQVSDQCIGKLMGVGSPRCYVPPDCWQIVMVNGSSVGYPLTHRLLYLQTARQGGCKLFHSKQETDTTMQLFCGKILEDAYNIEMNDFPEISADLFSEQVALCGMEGFTEYMQPAWLRKILSWQQPAGCFGNVDKYKKYLYSGRRKREDGLLGENCFMHFTAVASAAIATSLRLLAGCS